MRIEELISLNPWWKYGKEFWKYDKKFMEVKNFIEYNRRKIEIKPGNIYLIRGLRQVGKTTYFKQVILELLNSNVNKDNILYVSCDRPTSRKELRNIIIDFLKTRTGAIYLFLDEITYLKDWNIELKTIADMPEFERICLLATGSNPVKIKEKAERLPGRNVSEYLIFPLTFKEFLIQTLTNLQKFKESEEYFKDYFDAFKEIPKLLKEIEVNLEMSPDEIYRNSEKLIPFKFELDFLFRIYFLTDGFPISINSYMKNVLFNRTENVDSRVYEDILRLIFGDLTKMERSEEIGKEVLRNILERLTSRYNYNTIASASGYSHLTVMDYMNCFESGNIAYVLHSIDLSRKKEKTKADKKFYFSTHFLLNALHAYFSGVDGFEVSKENYLKLFDKIGENIVFSHLLQTKWKPYLKEWKTFLYFYYDQNKELDFVYKKDNGNFVGIEVKLEAEVKKIREVNGVENYVIITKNDFRLEENKIFVPISVFLSILKKSDSIL